MLLEMLLCNYLSLVGLKRFIKITAASMYLELPINAYFFTVEQSFCMFQAFRYVFPYCFQMRHLTAMDILKTFIHHVMVETVCKEKIYI